MKARPRAAVLVSGGGSTAVNLIEKDRAGTLGVSIDLVVSHRSDIAAVDRCRSAGVEVAVVDGPPCDASSDRLDAILREHKIDLVLLGGYLRRFRVGEWHGRVLNIHPALLPSFGGKGMYGDRVHDAVLGAGEPVTGCTVHLVDDEYDHGPMLLQRRVTVEPGDTVATLGARVRDAERTAYPEAVALWLSQRESLACTRRA